MFLECKQRHVWKSLRSVFHSMHCNGSAMLILKALLYSYFLLEEKCNNYRKVADHVAKVRFCLENAGQDMLIMLKSVLVR
jgi:hypothetical protein